MDERKLKELLLAESKEFRQAYEEHRRLEQELEKLVKKEYLTPEEEVREKKLKKRKLVLKDQMYLMMEDYRKRTLPQ
jgi:hypothetical protein